jgi:hypothetical protein
MIEDGSMGLLLNCSGPEREAQAEGQKRRAAPWKQRDSTAKTPQFHRENTAVSP